MRVVEMDSLAVGIAETSVLWRGVHEAPVSRRAQRFALRQGEAREADDATVVTGAVFASGANSRLRPSRKGVALCPDLCNSFVSKWKSQ